ncbi:MAG: GyrI-like domain-containing protein [Gammaproteobacteria bacterium]|nr:GyrI-like domain-containing protein [Gammaproteobacteria bacterium]
MPFLFRFMTKHMQGMIGKDYDLGLLMLRGLLDAQADRPVIRFDGEVHFDERFVLSIPFKGGITEMVGAMKSGFEKLKAHCRQQGIPFQGAPFTAYHKADPKMMHFECDMAIPVEENTSPAGFIPKQLGGGRHFKVTVEGSYDFLELAWYSVISHLRMFKIKLDKTRPSIEVYENDPDLVSSRNEIRTTPYVLIR